MRQAAGTLNRVTLPAASRSRVYPARLDMSDDGSPVAFEIVEQKSRHPLEPMSWRLHSENDTDP